MSGHTPHTPGAWHTCEADGQPWNIDAANGRPVALAQQCAPAGKPDPERAANAALIAAAPDLKTAGADLLAILSSQWIRITAADPDRFAAAVRALRAAIAKAEGRSS